MAAVKNGKTALVLAGGGLTGAVYEIGALRAIDDLLVDRTVNDFDIFVGTSAGALVGSFLANGVSPEEMLTVLAGKNQEIEPIQRQHIFGLDWRELAKWGVRLPARLAKAWSHYLRNIDDMTLFDLLWTLSETVPPGLYDGLNLETYIRETLAELGHSNHFDSLNRELYIIATDLDTGDRAIFGPQAHNEVPISMAVAASSALPVLYKPVRIGDDEYVDGGLRGTASLDLAIEQGATLVVCINPLVPFDHHNRSQIPMVSSNSVHLSDKGIQSITNQTIRILSYAGLHYHIKQLRRSHPAVDIILIEPQQGDYQMFFYNIMRYSARMLIAQHGFESVTIDLAKDYPIYKQILARHNIPISRRLVITELNEIHQSGNDPNVIRRVLEAKSAGCGQKRQHTPLCILNRTLAELEMALERMEVQR
jgi:NTE family protein